MKLIVGLGNPGAQYRDTRHNLGRRLVESLAKELKTSFSLQKKLHALTASLEWDAQEVILSYPNVPMNVSGSAVRALAGHFAIDPKTNLLIVIDDVSLPFGKVRLRPAGSDGGHNGLKSVNLSLGTNEYARLRLGIACEPQAPDLAAFVLQRFQASEHRHLSKVLAKGIEACDLWVHHGIESAMNVVNPSL